MVEDKVSLEFEARYYLSEAKRLQKQSMSLMRLPSALPTAMDYQMLTSRRASNSIGRRAVRQQ